MTIVCQRIRAHRRLPHCTRLELQSSPDSTHIVCKFWPHKRRNFAHIAQSLSEYDSWQTFVGIPCTICESRQLLGTEKNSIPFGVMTHCSASKRRNIFRRSTKASLPIYVIQKASWTEALLSRREEESTSIKHHTFFSIRKHQNGTDRKMKYESYV